MTSTTDQMRTLLAQTVEAANYAATQAAAAAKSAGMISGLAPLASPVFTGIPAAPTAAAGTNTNQIATTAFVSGQMGAANGIATLGSDGKLTASQLPPISVSAVFTVASQAAMLALAASVGNIAIRTDIGNAEFILTATPASTLANWTQIGTSPVLSVAGLTGAIVAGDLMTALAAAPLASPALTGTPTAPTAAGGTNTTQIATTQFVAASFAPLASPSLTGTPLAPTAGIDTNTGQIASCAFVLGQGSQSGDGTPAMDGTAARGTSTHFARADHVHPSDTSRAPLASPNFTGSPTAPTASLGDNSTLLATTAFVQANASSGFTTGDIKPTLKTTADSGWVMLNDGTIGSASSGGTTLASSTAQALFTLLYAYSDANFPLQTSTGAATTRAAQGSAATAWANNCRMSLPKALGRALASAGAGSGLTSRTLGQTLGEETHVLTSSEQASMSVSGSFSGTVTNSNDSAGTGVTTGPAINSPALGNATTVPVSGSISGTASGGGGAHNNMQPTLFVNWMVKL